MGPTPASLGFAFSAGLVAAFNPCGVVMLPSYVAYLLGQNREGGRMGWSGALLAGLLMTLGFVLVFGGVGLVAGAAGRVVTSLVPTLSVVVGALLVLLGLAFLAGYSPGAALAGRLGGRVGTGLGGGGAGGKAGRGGAAAGLLGRYLALLSYGVAYAAVSLSCTLPIFLAVTAQAFVAGALVAGIVVFLAYAAGMGVVVTGVTLMAALAGDWLSANLRRAIPVVKRLSGLVIIGAGVYIIYHSLAY